MVLPFLKMHGLGNDFIVVDSLLRNDVAALTPELARKMCDRRFGIGADQILWMKAPSGTGAADAHMAIFNADGSVAEMCGNGIRAAALYLHRYGPSPRLDRYRIDTLAGVKTVQVHDGSVAVDMGAPGLGAVRETLKVGGRKLVFDEVSMGNPHAVFFLEPRVDGDVAKFPVEELGPLVENHPRFPKRTNVEFVQVLSPNEIRVRVWERGAGITLACGTGACASAVASLASGRVKGAVTVKLPGGDLRISWAGGAAPVLMEGPATEVFRGEYSY